jgi:thiol-disulfide isomerase/thioredoxin
MAGFLARPPIQARIEGLKGALAQASRQRHLAATFLGKPAADLPGITLEGSAFRLSERRGKVVLLFFWASWCSYSREAIPAIQAVQKRYADRKDFEIIGVSLDRDRGTLERFVAERGINWTNLYDDGKGWNSAYAQSFQVRAIPSRWIIDRDLAISGAELGQAAVEDSLSVLLEGRHREPDPALSIGPATAAGGGCTALDVPQE